MYLHCAYELICMSCNIFTIFDAPSAGVSDLDLKTIGSKTLHSHARLQQGSACPSSTNQCQKKSAVNFHWQPCTTVCYFGGCCGSHFIVESHVAPNHWNTNNWWTANCSTFNDICHTHKKARYQICRFRGPGCGCHWTHISCTTFGLGGVLQRRFPSRQHHCKGKRTQQQQQQEWHTRCAGCTMPKE